MVSIRIDNIKFFVGNDTEKLFVLIGSPTFFEPVRFDLKDWYCSKLTGIKMTSTELYKSFAAYSKMQSISPKEAETMLFESDGIKFNATCGKIVITFGNDFDILEIPLFNN